MAAVLRRPTIGLALLGLGFFLIAAGLLARFYLFPHLAVLPLDRFERTESRAEGATYVDRTTGREARDRTLIAVQTMRGDVDASTPAIAVWESLTWTRDAETGKAVNYYHTKVALERHTGTAVDCCGHHIEGERYIPRSGLAYQWPFYTEKTSYPYFDEVLRKAFPMSYQRTDTLFGVKVYRFVQRIEPTRLGPQEVPGFMVGEPGTKTVAAERWYSVERTFWVEPRSGVVVKAGNHRTETLRVDGEDKLTLFDANVVLGDRDVRRFVAEAADASDKIALLHTGAFSTGLLAGALLVSLGAVLMAARRPAPAFVPAPEQQPVAEPAV